MINVDGEATGIRTGVKSYILRVRRNADDSNNCREYYVIIPFREAARYEARTRREIKIGMKLLVRGSNPLSSKTKKGISELCDEDGEIISLLSPRLRRLLEK